MASAVTNVSAEGGVLSRLGRIFGSFAERMEQYRVYRRTVDELQSLSARELADLGLNRGMIHSVALEAAYGTR